MLDAQDDGLRAVPAARHPAYDEEYDAGPTGCGELLMQLFLKFRSLQPGAVMKVVSYDSGTWEDIPAWCRMQGHRLLYREQSGQVNLFWIQKKENAQKAGTSRQEIVESAFVATAMRAGATMAHGAMAMQLWEAKTE